jgi:CHAT domain-containing protein
MERILGDPTAFRQTTVISYMQLATGLAVWVFDDRGITARWVAVSPQKLGRLARNFRDECADPNSDLTILRQDARRLYDLLIAPVSDHLSSERVLVIEPDDAIAEVPVAALLEPSGRYLGEVYPLVFSPGLLYQQHLHSAQKFTPHQRALAIGAPALGGDLADSLGPLSDATDEAQYVAAKFETATVFTGGQASLSNVRRELPRAAIFHFAGHAVANAEELGLMLAGPHSPDAQARTTAVLNVSNLTTIDLKKLQLAVLSACSTATGDEDEPRDPENLVRIFLRAGVPHVVASRWNVNSNTTAQFMHIFYDHLLLDHGSVSGSLQAAGAALRRAAGTAHPYYWAAFSAFGR